VPSVPPPAQSRRHSLFGGKASSSPAVASSASHPTAIAAPPRRVAPLPPLAALSPLSPGPSPSKVSSLEEDIAAFAEARGEHPDRVARRTNQLCVQVSALREGKAGRKITRRMIYRYGLVIPVWFTWFSSGARGAGPSGRRHGPWLGELRRPLRLGVGPGRQPRLRLRPGPLAERHRKKQRGRKKKQRGKAQQRRALEAVLGGPKHVSLEPEGGPKHAEARRSTCVRYCY
jgi:hypothetical protein